MKAWLLHDIGGPESFTLEEVQTPSPGPGEVRLRLETSALNHLDIWSSMGMPKPPLPHVAGADGAGVVDAIGADVTGMAIGDEVIVNPSLSCGHCAACLRGDIPFCDTYQILGEHRWGTFAEQVVAPARNVTTKPSSLSWEEAGAYGLAYGTAYRMLHRARLQAGEVLLVIGVGGGVSSAGMLIGKAMGATVFVTSRDAEKIEKAISLGADGGFLSDEGYDRALKAAIGRGADVVLENVGKPTWETSIRSLEKGGRLVTCGATGGTTVELTVPRLFFKQLQVIGSTMYDFGEFASTTRLIATGRVPVLIDSVFAFDDLPSALGRMQGKDQFGKILLRHG
ncbi:alcohol dehydrogenase [bacterium BMS3Abin02]|nr:alcohol dehydrogenase [bacterium BMS3Abin02]